MLPVSGGGVEELRAAAAQADASGEHVTPVVRISAPGTNAPEVLAVVPDSFPGVALFPGGAPADSAWDHLRLDEAEPVRLTGTRARLRLEVDGLRARAQDGETVPIDLWASLRTSQGPTSVRLARRLGEGASHPSIDLPCAGECVLTGFVLRTVPGSAMKGGLVLSDLRVDGVQVALDPQGGWHQADAGEATLRSSFVGEGLRIDVATSGIPAAELSSAWLPTTVPVLATEELAQDAPAVMGAVSGLTGLDGLVVPARLAAEVAHVPASGDLSMIANLEALQRLASGRTDAVMELWLDSPSVRPEVEQVLDRHELVAGSARSAADLGEELRGTSAAWSLQLALVVGAAGLLIAAITLVMVSIASWRATSRDLAALRLAGWSAGSVRRVAVAAQLPGIVVGVLAGLLAGALSARVAMPVVPLFATEPEVSLLDLDPAWWAILAAAAASLVILVVTGVVAGVGLARRSNPQRVREVL